jgi:hypothetical protein
LRQQILLSQKKRKEGRKKENLCPDRFWVSSSSLFMGSGVSSGDKAAAVEVDHYHQSNANVKNEWSYTSTLPVRLQGVNMDTFATYVHIL